MWCVSGADSARSLQMGAWVYTGEKLSKRIRERYLQSVLRQDVAVRAKFATISLVQDPSDMSSYNQH